MAVLASGGREAVTHWRVLARYGAAERPLAAVDQLTVRPELFSLLQDKSVYRFEGAAGGGDLSGRAPGTPAGG